jgi:hypothetical protein
MRTVIGAVPIFNGGIEAARLSGGCGSSGTAKNCRSRDELHPIAALVRNGRIPFRTPGKEGQAFSVSGIRAGITKKARSVVALSRVPR